MNFIEVTSLVGNKWLFRIDQIAVITKKTVFTEEERENTPWLKNVQECTIINLINSDSSYYSSDKYESIMDKILK